MAGQGSDLGCRLLGKMDSQVKPGNDEKGNGDNGFKW